MKDYIDLAQSSQRMTVHKTDFSSEKDQLSHILSSVDDENGEPVLAKERLKNASSGRAIFETMHEDDRPRSNNRARVQGMIDYKPPYDQKKLNQLGRSGQFNVNFGEGADTIHDAVTNYVDIFTATEELIELPLKKSENQTYTYEDSVTYSEILQEEFTDMVRGHDESMFNFLELVNKFVTHGIGVTNFPDKLTWMYESKSLQEFKFPQKTRANTSSVEITACHDIYNVSDLVEHIRNEKVAEESGWDVEEVKRVIFKSSNNSDRFDQDNYEDQQEKIQANEYTESTVTQGISVVKMWVKELSGKVSFYIFSRDGYESKDMGQDKIPETSFMFRKHEAYKCMTEAIQIFPFYTGTNGNIHTIRGLGHMIYPQVTASNLMQCSMLDSAQESMARTFTSNSEKDIMKLPVVHAGPYRVIPNHMNVVEQSHATDLQKSGIPAVNLLSSQISRKSSSSSLSSTLANGQDRRSSFEVEAAIEFFSSINASAMRLFFRPWRELLTEQAKRAFRRNQDEKTKAGILAKEMQEKCIERGVPAEIFEEIDFLKAKVKMPMGLGSKSARDAIFQKGTSLLSQMDEVGRSQFVRDQAVHLFGPEQARAYFPRRGVQRQPIDAKIAQLENNQMLLGMPVSVDPSENFIVHLKEHIRIMWDYVKSYEQGEQELVEVVQKIYPIWEHSNETIGLAVVPEIDQPEINQAKQSLQQLGEIISNGLKALQKQQREGQVAQEQEQVQNQDPSVSEDQSKLAMKEQEHVQNLRHKAESHQQEMLFKQQEHEQKKIQQMIEDVNKNTQSDEERKIRNPLETF